MVQDHPPRNRAERRAQARQAGRKQQGSNGKAVVIPINPAQAARLEAALEAEQLADSAEIPPPSPITGISSDWAMPSVEQTPSTGVTDRAPRGRSRGASSAAGGGKYARIKASLVTYYALIGSGVAWIAPYTGLMILNQADEAGDAWVMLAKEYPAVEKALMTLIKGGPILAGVSAHVPIVVAILAETEMISPQALSTMKLPPLEAAGPLRRTLRKQRDDQSSSSGPADGHTAASAASGSASSPVSPAPLGTPALEVPAELEPMIAQVVAERVAETGRPAAEVRAELLTELAQQQLAAQHHTNGRGRKAEQAPAALGAVPQ